MCKKINKYVHISLYEFDLNILELLGEVAKYFLGLSAETITDILVKKRNRNIYSVTSKITEFNPVKEEI